MTAGSVSTPLIIPIVQLQTHRAKNHINTTTPVSIQSDTPGALIFYTLDGTKPTAAGRGSTPSSRKYREPILLPAGQVCVKAVAVSSDGRQSSTVTKVFSVEAVDSGDREVSDRNFLQQCPTGGSSAGSSLRPPGPPLLTSRLGSLAPPPAQSVTASPSVVKQLSRTQTSRIQRQTNFLRCPQCLRFRPSDPFARFCAQCGAVVPPLPKQRLPPAEGGQTVLCVFCNTMVPARSHTCLICEAPTQQQPHTQAGLTLQAGPAVSYVVCWRCGAGGHRHALHCATCGVHLETPPPPTSVHDITPPVRAAAPHQATPSSDPPPTVNVAPPTVDQYTQTTGLYYPSATELRKKTQQGALQLSRQQSTRNCQPLLMGISPGRGYWRKQLDHVCAHLRSYTQNNAPFRSLLGEPRLGRMVSAVVQEDGYEVSLTLSFALAKQEEKLVCPLGGAAGPAGDSVETARQTESLSSITEQLSRRSNLRNDQTTGLMKPHKPNTIHKPPMKDVQLLKELVPGGGQISIIQQLLDQGADPSCCGSDSRHALAVAVINGHSDVLPVLVQRGADVDQQSGPMKNTALHEAAALGSEGLRCAEVLLSCRASWRRRNAAGQTAFDVAVGSGCSDMVSLLAARTGLDLLDRVGKPRLNLD